MDERAAKILNGQSLLGNTASVKEIERPSPISRSRFEVTFFRIGANGESVPEIVWTRELEIRVFSSLESVRALCERCGVKELVVSLA